LKIELSLQINTLNLPEPVIVDLQNEPIGSELRVSYRSKKVFAFADDCNILTTADKQNLDNLIDILDTFGEISGLACNIQKTNVLLIGCDRAVPVFQNDIPFNISQDLTILGFSVKNDDDNFKTNAEKIYEKIKKQTRIWTRYNLSLPGRLAISKTMLYSQLNYMGCVIPVPEDILLKIENEIFKFASGNLRIAKARVFASPETGGLGLFNVKNFLDAQTCAWIKRCVIVDQEWKACILAAGTGNLYLSDAENIDNTLFPVLRNILRSFSNFVTSFTKKDNNYTKAYLLNNGALTIGIRSKQPLKINDLVPAFIHEPGVRNQLINLRMCDLITPQGKITRRNFNINQNFIVTDELWSKLDKIRNTAMLRYGIDTGPAEQVSDFFNKWKKGSRKIRRIMDIRDDNFVPHNMVKYAENTETIIGMELSKFLNTSWNYSYLSNEQRTFIFKFHNNTLPYNTVLSHFVPGTNRNCTFCNLIFNAEIEDETPLHLFYSCNISEELRENFFKWLTNDNNFTVSRTELFTTFNYPNNFFNQSLFLTAQIFIKFLWDCKVRQILPRLPLLKSIAISETSLIVKINKRMKYLFTNSGLNNEFLAEILRAENLQG
jgi:hypothetical protein